MGTTERKEREKEQRRHDIIDSAERVFFSNGFENSTMADIARDAELSKGTLYLYFSNKNELCIAITIRGLDIFLKLLQKLKSQRIAGIDKFCQLSQIYKQFSIDFPNYYQGFLDFRKHHGNCPNDTPYYNNFSQRLVQINQLIKNIINDGIADGSILADTDSSSLAYIIWGSQDGILPSYDTNLRNHTGTKLTPTKLLDFHFAILRKSIEKNS